MHLPRVAAPSLASRVHDSAPWPRRIPAGPEPPARRKGQVRRTGQVGSPPAAAAAAGRPGGPTAPPPLLALCYSPTSCLRPPDPGSLPGPGSRRRPRVSRRRPRPPGSALRLLEARPGPGRPRGVGAVAAAAGSRRAGRLNGPGPRCPAPEGAVRPSGLRAVGGRPLSPGLGAQHFSVPGPEGASQRRRRPRVQLSLSRRAT